MPVTQDYSPNYAQLVSQMTGDLHQGSGPKQQQNGGQVANAVGKIAQSDQPGSTGTPLPMGTSSSSIAPGLNSADYAGAVDSSLGAGAAGAAGDAAAGAIGGAAAGAGADALAGAGADAAGEGIGSLISLLI